MKEKLGPSFNWRLHRDGATENVDEKMAASVEAIVAPAVEQGNALVQAAHGYATQVRATTGDDSDFLTLFTGKWPFSCKSRFYLICQGVKDILGQIVDKGGLLGRLCAGQMRAEEESRLTTALMKVVHQIIQRFRRIDVLIHSRRPSHISLKEPPDLSSISSSC